MQCGSGLRAEIFTAEFNLRGDIVSESQPEINVCQIFVCCGFCVCKNGGEVSARGCRAECIYIFYAVSPRPRVSMMHTQKKVSEARPTGPWREINLSATLE